MGQQTAGRLHWRGGCAATDTPSGQQAMYRREQQVARVATCTTRCQLLQAVQVFHQSPPGPPPPDKRCRPAAGTVGLCGPIVAAGCRQEGCAFTDIQAHPWPCTVCAKNRSSQSCTPSVYCIARPPQRSADRQAWLLRREGVRNADSTARWKFAIRRAKKARVGVWVRCLLGTPVLALFRGEYLPRNEQTLLYTCCALNQPCRILHRFFPLRFSRDLLLAVPPQNRQVLLTASTETVSVFSIHPKQERPLPA